MTIATADLHVSLGSHEVLHGIDLRIVSGEMVAVVGPNGSGKSTLIRTIAGVLRPSSGAVEIDGKPAGDLSPKDKASALGLLAQTANIPELTTVQEHVSLGRFIHRSRFARSTREDKATIAHAMETCQVTHLAARRMEELSGGERQRVRLATLLAQNPRSLLLDEPLTGLDIEHQLTLLHLLQDLNQTEARTVVCVLHDLDLALRFFDRVLVIHEGTLAADGTPSEVFCPRIFESVFRVDGRIGCESSGQPVIMCHKCPPRNEQPVEIVVRARTLVSQGVSSIP